MQGGSRIRMTVSDQLSLGSESARCTGACEQREITHIIVRALNVVPVRVLNSKVCSRRASGGRGPSENFQVEISQSFRCVPVRVLIYYIILNTILIPTSPVISL